MSIQVFKRGELYSHESIMRQLKVGNSGGIRIAKTPKGGVARMVLFSTSEQESNPVDNPYQDRSENGVLTYTGTGKIGHQNLSGQNLRITQQKESHFPIYVFSLLKHRKVTNSPEKRWRFIGIFKYLDHSSENQADLLGQNRNAWVFRLFKLDISEAHPIFEAAIAKMIGQSFDDPNLSARKLLPEAENILFEDIQSILDAMNTMDPFKFEHFVKSALVASDFREVKVTKKSSDGGVDIVARMPMLVWPIASQIIHVQVKRWKRLVGRREVAELRGSLIPRAFGVMITTGNYARTAIVEAERPHLQPISLVDGHRLAAVAIRLNLNITND